MTITRDKLIKYWFLLLMLSFAYEKPLLWISGYDRLNPRLFDICLILGFLVIPLKYKSRVENVIYKKWKKILIWFSIVVFLGIVLYPFPISLHAFSVYFLISYFKGLVLIWLLLKIPPKYISYDDIFKGLIFGGVFVGVYCVFEYIKGGGYYVEFAPGKSIFKPIGYVWGPFTNSYFEIANYSPLAAFCTIVYSFKFEGKKRILYTLVGFFIAWPVFFCGSRTAVGLLFLALFIFFFKEVNARKVIVGASFILVSIFLIKPDLVSNIIINNESTTISRLTDFEKEESHNSIENRLLYFTSFNLEAYTYNGILVPFVGAGFYVAPVNDSPRIGYGFHNIYLFALEQSGLIGFVLFITFIATALKYLGKKLDYVKSIKTSNYWFTLSVYCFFIASLIIGLSGHTFWMGFSTENHNTLRILLLVFATSEIVLIKVKNEKNIIGK